MSLILSLMAALAAYPYPHRLSLQADGTSFVVTQADTYGDIVVSDSAIKRPLIVNGGKLGSTPIHLLATGRRSRRFLTFEFGSANQGFLRVILVGKSSLQDLGMYPNADLYRNGRLISESLAKWMDGEVPSRYGPNTRVRTTYRFDWKRRVFAKVGQHYGPSVGY